MYLDHLLLAARKVHVVYYDQLLGAAPYIHFLSNRDSLNNIYNKLINHFLQWVKVKI